MASRAKEVQKAIFDKLESALAIDVSDFVEAGKEPPYVELGEQQAEPDDTLETPGEVHELEIVIWSKYHGKSEVLEISDAIYEALHDQELPLSAGCAIAPTVTRRVARRVDAPIPYTGSVFVRVRTSD